MIKKESLPRIDNLKIAFVYDRVVKFGGAERILLALKEIWPDSPLYTAIYDPPNAQWAQNFKIKDSFLRFIPGDFRLQEILPVITPYVFEKFSFDNFDIVISCTSQDAKSIITKPATLHICYNLTPTRYLWSGFNEYYRQPSLGIINPLARLIMKMVFPYFRKWDVIISSRPDYYLAISKTVRKRIKAYYQRDSQVVYPPVDTDIFVLPKVEPGLKYFLIVSRLVSYKRIDYAIHAFNNLPYPLKVIGSGIDQGRLKKIAGKNIEFIDGDLTDRKLCWYYQNCLALIFPGEEDFGLTPLEVQSCGRPVIALREGGATESIINGSTGLFYREKNEKALTDAVNDFFKYRFNPLVCRNNALRFSRRKFIKNMKEKISQFYTEYKSI